MTMKKTVGKDGCPVIGSDDCGRDVKVAVVKHG